MSRHQICEHAIVRLRRPVGNWQLGTEGTVVAAKGASKLVEIADEQGNMLDLVTVIDGDLDLVWSPAEHSRSA